MALIRSLQMNNKLLSKYNFCGFLRIINTLHQSKLKKNILDDDDNALDEFVTHLVLRRTDKWKSLREKKICNRDVVACKVTKRKYKDINLSDKNVEEIDALLRNAIEEDHFEYTVALMKECIRCNKCPSISMLMLVLSMFSQNGEKQMIIEIQNLYEKLEPSIINANSGFQHYLAEATWMKGNIDKALTLFDTVYRNNPFLRKHVKLTLKYLILDIINERSEAVLNKIISFCQKLVADYDDYFLLGCVWQSCFLSEWYSDQCIAMDIFNKTQCPHIVSRIPYVVNIALHSHQTDLVHRLLEMLLKYEMRSQYSTVLMALFNYRCKFNFAILV